MGSSVASAGSQLATGTVGYQKSWNKGSMSDLRSSVMCKQRLSTLLYESETAHFLLIYQNVGSALPCAGYRGEVREQRRVTAFFQV